MKNGDKLRANWGKKQKDIMLHHPAGIGTKSDAHWLAGIFDEKFQEELEKRGYDITTLNFSIAPMKGDQRFLSQQKTEKEPGKS